MTMVQPISGASDRVMAALIGSLELEFGRGAAEGLAQRFIAAEECDFCWDARIEERWLGAHATLPGDEVELDRLAIWGRLQGKWFAAVMLVDGGGMAQGMLGKRMLASRKAALAAYHRMR